MANDTTSFAVIDLSVSLLSFVNIELRSQGWYAMRTRILPDPRIKAVWMYRTALSEVVEQPPENQVGKVEEGWSWHSRVFPVRYTREEMPLGECPCFQVFLREPLESLGTASLQIELELLHHEADIVSNPVPPVTFHLKPVGRDVVRLSRVCDGVAAYYPATWGPAHFGLCHITFYALLSGYVPARVLYNLRATTGRDLRRPLSQRIPSRKFERSLSLASATSHPEDAAIKKGGWRGLMCSNVDTDQVATPTAAPHLKGIDSIREDAKAAAASSYTGMPHQLLQGAISLLSVLQTMIQDGGSDMDMAMADHQRSRVQAVYEALVMTQRRAIFSMNRTLKGLPASCYMPQSYDVLRTLLAREFNARNSPESSPSAISSLHSQSSPRSSSNKLFGLSAKWPSRSDSNKASATAAISTTVANSANAEVHASVKTWESKKGTTTPEREGMQHQHPAAGGSPRQSTQGPKYTGNAPTPVAVTPSQIAMTAAPSFAGDVSPPPFSLSRISRSLGLVDRTWSSGAPDASPLTNQSSSPFEGSQALASPTPMATPPLPMPSQPILLTPPEPVAAAAGRTQQTDSSPNAASVNGGNHAACTDSSHEQPLEAPQTSHTSFQAAAQVHPSIAPLKTHVSSLNAAAGPDRLPPSPIQGDTTGKVMACAAVDHKGGAVAVPRLRLQQAVLRGSGVLPPSLQSARTSRKWNSDSTKPEEEQHPEAQSNQGTGHVLSKKSTVHFAEQHHLHSSSKASHWHQSSPSHHHQQRQQSSRKGSQRSSLAESTSELVATDVASWPEIPEPAVFMEWLPSACSLGTAVLHLDAVLGRLRSAASSEWAVLQWVLRMSNTHATKFFKCQWEAEQPWTVQPWVALGIDTAATQSAADLESKAHAVRQALQQQINSHQLLPPQIYQPRVWDDPGHQPILLVDDSQAKHITTWCMNSSTQQHHPQANATPPRTSRNHPEADSLECYNRNNRGTHVCVFVHGYQGVSTDLSLIKGQLGMLYPHIDMLCSKANEGKTQENLQAMGDRLATEVVDKLALLASQSPRRPLAALSFVGHSLGTLIARAALASPKMAPYLPKLELFVSICGPHLGNLYSKNGLVEMGVGFLKLMSVKGSCLHQLALSDCGRNARLSWLYKLAIAAPSGPGSLQLFRSVVLVASAQDRYVPLHSARVVSCEAAQQDSNKQRKVVFAEMVDASTKGFGGGPGTSQLLRVDVDFPAQGTNSSFFNNLLGRTAHIALIEDTDFARSLVWGVIRRYKLIRPDVVGAWLP